MSGENAARLSQIGRSSRPWWLRHLAALLIVPLVGLVCFLVRQVPHEPVYRGKALSLWLRTYAPSSPSGRDSREWKEADDALSHIGTNCIPALLHMLREKDSKVKLRMVALAQKQRWIKTHFVPAAERNIEASRAFIVLGATAKGAVPALLKLYDDNVSADSQCAIEDAFSWIGPAAKPALPSLLRAATNSAAKVRANAFWALGEIQAEPELCIPRLIQGLSDSDDWARISAAHSLGMFGSAARSAIPALTELATMPRAFKSPATMGLQVSLEARNALAKIDTRVVSPSNEAVPEFGIPATDSPISLQ